LNPANANYAVGFNGGSNAVVFRHLVQAADNTDTRLTFQVSTNRAAVPEPATLSLVALPRDGGAEADRQEKSETLNLRGRRRGQTHPAPL
jgi:hypothetical protein